ELYTSSSSLWQNITRLGPSSLQSIASRLVGRLHCSHGVEKPEPLPVIKTRDERRKTARDHPGTCDVHQAELIAAVSINGVCEGNSREAREGTYKTFCNQ
ncbi:unnamed protein product, partial [Pylaiella littoralis]